ncbi:hypothetical protein [Verrucomicrobium sp. BvORR034]|uniref:hypothetical protein n=1 Tax=Verrucomicrobium sp. BvORR034 TaxID=1396418 RepID=UPI000679405E|nr:hypothetical protein [Verrucomicrobium sp. BvORR034]
MKVAEATFAFDAMPSLKVDGEVRTFTDIQVNGETFKGVDMGNGSYARLTDRTEGRFDVTLFSEAPDHDLSNMQVSVTGGGVSRLQDTEGHAHGTDNVHKLDHEAITLTEAFFDQFLGQDGVRPLPDSRPLPRPPGDGPGDQGSTTHLPQGPPPQLGPPLPSDGLDDDSGVSIVIESGPRDRTPPSLEELSRSTGLFLRALSNEPTDGSAQAVKLQNFATYLARIPQEEGSEKAAFQPFTDQVKSLTTKELTALSAAFTSAVGNETNAEALAELSDIVQTEITARRDKLDTEVRLWSDSLSKALAVHEGELTGSFTDHQGNTHQITEDRATASKAFVKLVEGFNTAMMNLTDTDYSSALATRVVGGLGSDGRKIFLQALAEHTAKGQDLPFMKMALRDEPPATILDHDGSITKAQEQLRATGKTHISEVYSQLTRLEAELYSNFADHEHRDHPAKHPSHNTLEFFSFIVRFHALAAEYERATTEFGLPPAGDFESRKAMVRDRLAELTQDLDNLLAPITDVPTGQIPLLQDALAYLRIPQLDGVIAQELLNRAV